MIVQGAIFAFLAATLYGLGSVLQAYASRQEAEAAAKRGQTETPVEESFKAMLKPLFLVGTILDLIGFVGNTYAAKLAPLFLVQPIMCSNLLFAAIFGFFIMKSRLTAYDIICILVIVGGLSVLGLTASTEGHNPPPAWLPTAVLITAIVATILGILITLLKPGEFIVTLGLMAGILFGLVAIAIRMTHSLWDISTLSVLVAGGGAFYLFITALQSGSAAKVLASLTTGETSLPAAVGVYFFGDATAPGLGYVAVAGFIVAVAGTLMLTRSPNATI